MFHVPNYLRVRKGPLATQDSAGNNGAFTLDYKKPGVKLHIVVSDGEGWEHVSVHAEEGGKKRTPKWEEMTFVKDAFWGPEDVVMQLHPAQSQYVNNHRNVLHLWRPTGAEIPSPPAVFVGIPGLSRAEAEQLVGEAMGAPTVMAGEGPQ